MKKYAFNDITLMQYIFLIAGIQMGVGLLQLPRELAELAGTDGWIAIVICFFIATCSSLTIVQVMKRYPDGTLFDLLKRYAGKWVGRAAAVLTAMYFAFFSYTIMVRAVLFIKSWILPKTPDFVMLILLAIPSYLLARGGVRVLGRYAEIVLYITLWMPFFYLLSLRESNWLYMLPVFKEGLHPILLAMKPALYAFLGFEASFLLYPFLKSKQYASRGIVIANVLTLLVYLHVTVTCNVFYSPDAITHFNEPSVNLLKTMEFRFIERLEIVFLSFFIMIISTTWLPGLYLSVFSINWIFGREDHRKLLQWVMLLFVGSVIFVMPTFNKTDKWIEVVNLTEMFFGYLFPYILWLYVWLHDRLRWRRGGT
ncbi:spore germination protein (amino acid permease) [Paenibacillus tianmuensis]|uniref:Spore germination protein (Amino acid permease) n=1 Tax=Paenibacillus tianmuensis TaxID=624147 RepID=A0A1G4PH68_9BACL|nr:endospore germination permease [Paenibacillus tianmuensis]SCW31399.1 spore germination protein (amino acid permease) [Paenibacillus tianmuensis]